MPRRVAVIGHPLAAEENRLAFAGWTALQVHLIAPRVWKARGLGHTYRIGEPVPAAPGLPSLHSLSVLASGRNTFFSWVGLGSLLRRIMPDVIYCWEEPWCLATWQIGSLARKLGIPMVFYSAENRPKSLPWPFTRLLRRAFSECPAAIVPTAEIASRLRSWGYPGVIIMVPLWIRPRCDLGPRKEDRQLAYVGRLIPLKRVGLIVESLVHLPDFRLRIIGDGPEGPRLRGLASDLGVGARVDFLGHVGNAALETALKGASLLILPTGENPRQAEQFGKAALEAVTMGLPVLASRAGNLAALAAEFPTVTAGDFGSPEQLAESVMSLFRDFPTEGALAAARRSADRSYGPAVAARRLESALEGILSPGAAS